MGNRYARARNAVALKIETVPGTYDDPTAVLPMEAGGEIWSPDFDKDEFTPLTGTHGAKETDIVTMFASVSVGAKMKLPTDRALIAPALEMCGIKGTAITGGTSYTYDTTKISTASLKQTAERHTTKIYGARSDLSIIAEVGQSVGLELNIKGLLEDVVHLNPADPDNAILDAPVPERVFMTKECTAYLVNGNQAHFKKVSFKLNAEVVSPKDTCAGATYTKETKPELSVTMSVTQDNENAFNDLKNGTEFNFVIPFFDLSGNKVWELVVPKAVVIEQKTPENEGLLNVERTLECRRVSGDDNFELIAYHA